MDLVFDTVKVSICCITYNHKDYIKKCLDGFLMQKTNFVFEVLIHDDASSDGTAEIIREYAEQYPEIIKPILQKKNQWSQGIDITPVYNVSRAKGEYIALCEGDDFWLDPYKLQMEVDYLDKNPDCGMCYTRARQYNQSKNRYLYKSMGGKVSDFNDLLLYGNRIPTLTTCFRKDIYLKYYEEIGNNNTNWLMSDYPLWLYFILKSKIHFFSKKTACYRVLTESASHSQDINKYINFQKSYFDIRNYYIKNYTSFNSFIFDEHNARAWFMFRHNIGVRSDIESELNKSIKTTKKDKLLLIILSKKYLFTFAKIIYYIKKLFY